MSKRKFLLILAAIAFVASGTHVASAQSFDDGMSLGPSARPFGDENALLPDADYFEYDAQLWAPYDVTSMDGRPRLNQGFYAELGFSYLSISRPGAVPGADPRNFRSGSDFHWARDLELGYMNSKDAGWAFGWVDAEGLVFLNGEDRVVVNPMTLRTTFDDLELNRQFRQVLSSGAWVEPYIGFRYINITDRTIQDNSIALGSRFGQKVNNSALGGQVGARFFRDYGRFRLGTDVSLAALYNNEQYVSYFVGNGTILGASEFTNEDNSVAPTLDLEVKLNYALTRDISLRGGVGLTYIWDNVARADTRTALLNPNALGPIPSGVNDSDFIAAGFSFGLDWRR